MKEVMVVIRINKINATKRALNAAGITSFTATNRVLGRGKGVVDYRVIEGAKEGSPEAIALLGDGPCLVPKRLLIIVVSDNFLDRTVKAIIDVNQTGQAGDGKIFVMPILEATRIRTGETVKGASGSSVLDSSGV